MFFPDVDHVLDPINELKLIKSIGGFIWKYFLFWCL